MRTTLDKLFATLVLAVLATTAQAGVFFTDESLFNAALSGQLAWSEDFEGFTPAAPVPPGVAPLVIGGGQGLITTSTGNGLVPVAAGAHAADPTSVNMLGVFGPLSAALTGAGVSSLDAKAISANVAFEFATQIVVGLVGGGAEVSPLIPGSGLAVDTIFVGWIGNPGELATGFGFATEGGAGVDNIAVYVVPMPATLLLILGALPLLRRKLA